MTLRVCIEPTCPTLARDASRCDQHRRAQVRQRSAQRGTRQAQGYGPEWQRIRREAIKAQPWCSHCFATEDLTADHVVALARGGTAQDGVQVLCRGCNSRKADR